MTAMRGAGFPMGPFELMDLAGLDVNLAAARGVWEGLGRPERLRPSPIQERLVAAGPARPQDAAAGSIDTTRVAAGHVDPEFAEGPARGLRSGPDPRADRGGHRRRGAHRDRRGRRAARRRRHRAATGRRPSGAVPRDALTLSPDAGRRPPSRGAATIGGMTRDAAPARPRGLDRRGRPDADRPLRRRARERPARRPRRARAARGRRPLRHRPGARRGRHPRLRQPGRRGQPQRRADGGCCSPACRSRSAGQTVNRLCGSGLQAINAAAHAIAVGDGDVFIAAASNR